MPKWMGFNFEKLIEHYTNAVTGKFRTGDIDIEMMRKEIIRRGIEKNPDIADSEEEVSQQDSRFMTLTKFAWDEKVSQVNQLKQDNKRLLEAIKSSHLSLTWCNTDQQIPAAVWHLEQVLPQGPLSTEYAQRSGGR